MDNLALSGDSESLARFKQQRDAVQGRLDRLNELIDRLEANPELLRVMDLIRGLERNDDIPF